MSSPAPYADHVGELDPVAVLRSSLEAYTARVSKFSKTDWQKPWAPGKWTIAQILVHVTQWEMIMAIRARCGVAAPDFTVQPLDQDELMRVEGDVVPGPTAFDAFVAVRRMNIAFAEALSPAMRQKRVMHPERGAIDVEQLLVTLAGHGVHHFKQIASVR